MKKTVTVTLAALLTIVVGCASTQPVATLRGADVPVADAAPAGLAYVGKKPGLQQPIARTFVGQPPLIPHAVDNFSEITLEGNQCMDCHSPEKAKEKRAPKVGDTHLTMTEKDGKFGKALIMTRFQCDSCHVPQVDAKPLVDNAFVGHNAQ